MFYNILMLRFQLIMWVSTPLMAHSSLSLYICYNFLMLHHSISQKKIVPKIVTAPQLYNTPPQKWTTFSKIKMYFDLRNAVETTERGGRSWRKKNTWLLENHGKYHASVSIRISKIIKLRGQCSTRRDVRLEEGWPPKKMSFPSNLPLF
jgi:hypothetical protein